MTSPDTPARADDSPIKGKLLALVAMFAIGAAAPSLLNGFAYDDRWIILDNERVHALGRWRDWFTASYWPVGEASLYRPLTTAGFALQWVIGGGSPFLFHLMNVLLYAAGAVAFTVLAGLVLPATAAVIVGSLWAVDPVHVEAFANGVGQSELSAGLVMLAATAIYVRARRAGAITPTTLAVLAALYLVGGLLKEHAITLPAWFLAAEVTVLRDTGESTSERAWSLASLFGVLAVIAAGLLAARGAVLGAMSADTPHPAINGVGLTGRMFVMLGVLPDLARLLVWPSRLYADYSPAQLVVSTAPDSSQLPGVAIIVAAIALLVLAWRHSRVAAFGLLIAGAAWLPTANIVFPSGILLSERTLYLPTAGVLLAAGVLIDWLHRQANTPRRVGLGAALVVLLLAAGVGRSADRSRVWKSDESIFTAMRADQPLSFRAHYAWGLRLFEAGDMAGGEKEWREAIRLTPTYPFLYADLADRYRENNICQGAIPMYETALKLDPGLLASREGLVACHLKLAQYTTAAAQARVGIAMGIAPEWFQAAAHSADSALAATDSTR